MPWPPKQLLIRLALAWGKRGAAQEVPAPPGITARSPIIFGKAAPPERNGCCLSRERCVMAPIRAHPVLRVVRGVRFLELGPHNSPVTQV